MSRGLGRWWSQLPTKRNGTSETGTSETLGAVVVSSSVFQFVRV